MNNLLRSDEIPPQLTGVVNKRLWAVAGDGMAVIWDHERGQFREPTEEEREQTR